MMRRCTLTLAFCIAVSWPLASAGQSGLAQDPPPAPPVEDETPKEKVTLGLDDAAEEYELELAVNADQRAQGLMEREEIEEHGGMLFIYPDAEERGFWMKNCIIDIDMIFLDEEGRITAVHQAKKELPQQPDESEWDYEDRLKRYPSRRPAQFVIEVKAGTIKRLGLKPGHLVDLDVERLAKLAEN
jgi:uncharacterized membrane protein (UPF0127 family)